MSINEFEKQYKNENNFRITILSLFFNAGYQSEELRSTNSVYVITSLDSEIINKSILNCIKECKEQETPIAITIPKTYLFYNSSQPIREKIVLENLLETVIVIPSYWVNNANRDIDMSILFLNPKSKRPGNIKFVDITYDSGSDLVPDGLATINLLYFDAFPDIDNLIGDMYDEGIDLLEDYFSEFICIAGNYTVKADGFSLDPAHYINRIMHVDGYSLYELWYTETKTIENARGRIIHLSDLKDSPTCYELDVSSIAITEEKGKFYQLQGRGIIVAKKGGTIKPTLVDTNGLTVYAPCEDMEIIADNHKDKILLEYIVGELYKDYVRWQYKGWQCDLLSYLRIRIPEERNGKTSIEIQQMDSIRSRYQDICDYCKREDLVELLWMLSDERIQINKKVPQIIRDIIGDFILQKLLDLDIVNVKISPIKTNIRAFSNALSNNENVPIYIKRIFHDFSDIVQDGAHPLEVQSHLLTGKAPFLNKMLIYELLTVLKWCLIEENKR